MMLTPSNLRTASADGMSAGSMMVAPSSRSLSSVELNISSTAGDISATIIISFVEWDSMKARKAHQKER